MFRSAVLTITATALSTARATARSTAVVIEEFTVDTIKAWISALNLSWEADTVSWIAFPSGDKDSMSSCRRRSAAARNLVSWG
jgi:hypothetical protein